MTGVSPMIVHWFFWHTISLITFHFLMVQAWRKVFEFEWRATYSGPLRVQYCMPNWVWPQWTDIECSSFKPPQCYLQACAKNILNMEGVVSKTTKIWPKVMLSLKITLVFLPNAYKTQAISEDKMAPLTWWETRCCILELLVCKWSARSIQTKAIHPLC